MHTHTVGDGCSQKGVWGSGGWRHSPEKVLSANLRRRLLFPTPAWEKPQHQLVLRTAKVGQKRYQT